MHQIHTLPIFGFREPFSSISHMIGAAVFAALAVELIARGRGNRLRMISLAVMAYATIQTLVLSSVYHMLWPGPDREFMLRADVAGIFLLIAGCITPVHAILFRGTARWAPLALIWTVAISGMTLRTIYFDHLPNVAGITLFLIFGWGGAITASILWWRFGWKFVRSGVLAGMSYTAGALVLLAHQPVVIDGVIGPHELWHLAVLIGLGLHWNFVFQFAGGRVNGPETHSSPKLSHVGPPHILIDSFDRRAGLEFPQPIRLPLRDVTERLPNRSADDPCSR